MSERRLLTPTFVDNIDLPISGERWISDTMIAGFGVRLWRTGNEGKSFAVRLRDTSGRQIRRTYPAEQSRAYRNYLYRGASFSLGACLEEARLWALDEIDKSNGRLTLAEVRLLDKDIAAERIKQLTLRTAADLLLRGLYSRGVSQSYLDRLEKLFSNHVPASIHSLRLDGLNVEDIARVLVDPDLSFGNIRILRAFVSQIFEEAAWFYGPFGSFKEDLSEAFWPLFKELRDVRFPALRSWSDDDYERILMFLDKQNEWQAANAIALFLNWGAPLVRVMRARWGEIFKGHWYPYGPDQKVYWFECREEIKPHVDERIGRIKSFVIRDFSDSEYLFPSAAFGGERPITSVDRLWRRALSQLGYPFFPLRDVGLRRRQPTRPSYMLGFLRQYGEMFRDIQNMADVSRCVTENTKPGVISEAYTVEHVSSQIQDD